MNRTDVQGWLDRYVAAWRSGGPDLIGVLFTEDAVYRYRPYGPEDGTLRGREAIVKGWQDDEEGAAGWEAQYQTYAVDGDRAVATGVTRYFATGDELEKTYHNAFLLRFDADGRCAEFTEYFMLEQPARRADHDGRLLKVLSRITHRGEQTQAAIGTLPAADLPDGPGACP